MNPRTTAQLFLTATLAVWLPTISYSQSLWHDDVAKAMYVDKRATGIGDIITIIVQENSTANKNNETKTERKSSLTAAISSFLIPGLAVSSAKLPAVSMNSNHAHDGTGAINNSESMIAHIAVTVVDVLPNKNLVVEGKRETAFSGERQTITLRGIVRAEDVSANNTVLSYNVADATIQIVGKGTVTDGTKKGWFNRIWDKINPL